MIKNLKIKLYNISVGETSNESLAVGFVRHIMADHFDFFEEFLIKQAMKGKRSATIQLCFNKQESGNLHSYGFGVLLLTVPMIGHPDLRLPVISTLREILTEDYMLIVDTDENNLSLNVRW